MWPREVPSVLSVAGMQLKAAQLSEERVSRAEEYVRDALLIMGQQAGEETVRQIAHKILRSMPVFKVQRRHSAGNMLHGPHNSLFGVCLG